MTLLYLLKSPTAYPGLLIAERVPAVDVRRRVRIPDPRTVLNNRSYYGGVASGLHVRWAFSEVALDKGIGGVGLHTVSMSLFHDRFCWMCKLRY